MDRVQLERERTEMRRMLDRQHKAVYLGNALAIVEGMDGYEAFLGLVREKRDQASQAAADHEATAARAFPTTPGVSLFDYIIACRQNAAEARAAAAAYDTVLNLIPSLVKQGKDVVEQDARDA